MNYVEWLRVKNALVIVAILLGVLVVGGLVLRVAMARYLTYDHWVSEIQKHPGVTVQQTTAPDGAPRLIVDDPREQTHIVVDDHGFSGKQIAITEPAHRDKHQERVNIGSVSVTSSRNGSMETVLVDTNAPAPLLYYLAIADFVAIIVATILAAPLARENEGHLEIAATKPVSRMRYAIGSIGADVVGIFAASAMTIVALILVQAMFELPRIDTSGVNMEAVLMGIAWPIAWYAMLCAATASLKRGYGMVLGLAWPASLIMVLLARINPEDSPVLAAVRGTFWVLTRPNPISYISFGPAATALQTGTSYAPNPDFVLRLSIELSLFVLYVALAIVQWRRVEA